jgi:hypothetical protein
VSVRDIGTCVMTVQADSATAADSRPMARHFSSPRSTSKFIPPFSTASALQTDHTASSLGLASQAPTLRGVGYVLRLPQGNMVPRSDAAPIGLLCWTNVQCRTCRKKAAKLVPGHCCKLPNGRCLRRALHSE